MRGGAAAAEWIARLDLSRHPEGGWYRRGYCSQETHPATALPPRFGAERAFLTVIYYLLSENDFSALHRIKSYESWHFYSGGPVQIHSISPQGELSSVQLGNPPEGLWHTVIEPGCWFGARLCSPADYALLGCVVAPGFDFADFELARRQDLLLQYPAQRQIIEALTRE